MTEQESPAPLHPALDEPLATFDVPTRIANWAARNDVATLRDLLCRDPAALVEERNLGRTSLRQTRELVLDLTGQPRPDASA